MKTEIVDTNVILVANGQHDAVSSACVTACVQRLHTIMQSGRVAIDEANRIIDEYKHQTSPWKDKRPGDVFFKWLLQNQSNPKRCDRVSLKEHHGRGFESFPEDKALERFDNSDRKFVAVAVAHAEHPPIAQAADSKWLGWAAALKACDVHVDFLCPVDIKRFDDGKKSGKRKRG